jgi:hypothetical protein
VSSRDCTDSNFSAEDKDGYRILKAVPEAFSYVRIRPVYDIVGALPPGVKRTAPLCYEASETSDMTFGSRPARTKKSRTDGGIWVRSPR